MPLYHLAMFPLREGSIIEPGNFGRMLHLYKYATDNGWMVARELAFEMARLRVAPEAPSRLKACYALGSLEEARRYQDTNARFNVMIEVELSEPDAPQHWGYMQHFDGFVQQEFMPAVSIRADAYWSGVGTGDRELVTASGLRVLRMVS
ncbi:DUF2441 domain-containing protein [Agrobacterium vitis]|uniref:DUF2441 domain-containing protein n=1 Tax=Allorhizobium ampelinum TaxID=3025782 RepID=UPI001F3267D2|nr:DUF2441 domain-containing protein [Allorhizobium ampelinum]MCF1449970.1 DUF2441 domain-containing protein [Allorhizobium ampelinum]